MALRKCIDLTGQKFGRLTVIKRVKNDKHGGSMWLCKCDCGTIKTIRGNSLRQGLTVSCGCYQKEATVKSQTTHGSSKTRLFHIWQNMKRRCYNPNYKFYNYYGGRGITICDEWLNNFSAFKQWSLQNGYTNKLTIDRINSNGNYEPSNCRWVSRKTQQNNTRRTRLHTINGVTHSITEWSRIYNMNPETIRHRVVNEHWDILTALTTPPLKRNGQPR